MRPSLDHLLQGAQGAAGPLALKVTATCSGSPGATGTGAALLFVRAQGMYQPGDVAELSW